MDADLLAAAEKALPRLTPAVQQKVGALIAEARRIKTQQLVQTDFMAFTKYVWPTFINGRHHEKMARAFERVARGELKRLIVNMPPRHRLSINTPIPTANGWKTVETVAVGSFVFSPNGHPVKVTGKSAVYEEDIYEVVTSDGQIIECDAEHLWTVRFGSGRPYETFSTAQILHKLETETWRQFGNLPVLPPQVAARYPYRELPIDPYVLGVWLGDGSSSGASIGCSYADLPLMRRQIEACGYQTTHNPKFQQFNVLGLHQKLREVGLLGNKHIPEGYLCASIEQRLALLQGLIDTDGDVTKEGKVTFNQTNLPLMQQVLCLVHSLGIKARITERQTTYNGIPSQKSYRIMFKAENAARLPRKANRCKPLSGNWGRSIDIRRTNRRGAVRCLEVANEDGLFMAGRGWVVTHNTKSEFASYLLPAWFFGLFPEKKIIQTSHTAELAVGFGRKVRNLVDSDRYKDLFPELALQADSKAAGRWSTNKAGEYFAIGVGGAVTGKGADLLIIDDPHSEQEATLAETNPEVYDKTYEWYTSGPRQRLQPGGAIVLIQTRWSKKDLTGQVTKAASMRDGEQWEVIEFPAILPSGNPLWPEFWKIEELEALKKELPASKWQAQYMQAPTSDVSAIIKREWWQVWEKEQPPPCEFLIQSWDTAFLKTERSDYSACTTWGVFYQDGDDGLPQSNIILLNAFKKRMEFPELKQRAYQEYKQWEPDAVIVEAKAAGSPLIFELRHMGIPVQEFTPSRGNDKIARLNAVADLFASGRVWVPETRWAEELVEEVASFPSGEHDDLCLVGETMILMADRSSRPLCSIRVDDWVATPQGACRVSAAGFTGLREVWRLQVGSCKLLGTGNHPVFCDDGWRTIDSVTQACYVYTYPVIKERVCTWASHQKVWFALKRLCSMGTRTIGILTQKIQHIGAIFLAQTSYCTGQSGNTTTGLSLKGIRSITRTKILLTTGSKIWNASPINNIVRIMRKHTGGRQLPLNNSHTSPGFGILPKHGILPLKVLNGIANTSQNHFENRATLPRNMHVSTTKSVIGAAHRFWRLLKEHRFARSNAHISELGFVRVSTNTNTHTMHPVFNLTVEGAHCFYANGILTHNCDSMSQALLRYRKGGFIRLESDEQDPERRQKRRNRPFY